MLGKLKGLFSSKEKVVKYKCSCCGKEHEEWPALVYDSPIYYSDLSEEDKKNIAELTSDICIIKHPEHTHRFVRGVLNIPVNDSCCHLEYGLWVSLSEKSFEDYQDNYNNDDREGAYFGWTCNNIEGYDTTLSIASDVLVQKNGFRPYIVPHDGNDHVLVNDYYNGISLLEAEKRINAVIQKSQAAI